MEKPQDGPAHPSGQALHCVSSVLGPTPRLLEAAQEAEAFLTGHWAPWDSTLWKAVLVARLVKLTAAFSFKSSDSMAPGLWEWGRGKEDATLTHLLTSSTATVRITTGPFSQTAPPHPQECAALPSSPGPETEGHKQRLWY